MKKGMKLIAITIFSVIILMSFANVVFGVVVTGGVDPSSLTGGTANTEKITNVGNQIITIISVVGSVAAVIVLVILGLKYMMGSAEEKAEYKKTLLPYVIGALLVFAASAIAGMVYQFSANIQ